MALDLHGISQAAFDLIVEQEDSSREYYERHYTHFEWPAGASGPTVGIGYDCGYVTQKELVTDWRGIVSEETITKMLPACGLRGNAAHEFVRSHGRDVTITWDQAIEEFANREVPKWVQRVTLALPNSITALSPDCKGALVSLAYNRGASFDLHGPRFAEMRAIKEHMARKEFDKIPAEIRHMKRLWPNMSGLRRRRDLEASLFERGLKDIAP